MYSQQLTSVLEGRKNFLTIIWLIVPFESLVFTALAYFLKSQIQIAEMRIEPNILYIVAAVLGFSSISAGAVTGSLIFKNRLNFDQHFPGFKPSDEQSEILASLSYPEKIFILAYRRSIAFLVVTQSLFTFPLVFGLIAAVLLKNTFVAVVAAAVALLAWKTFIPAPDQFNRRFHQNADPQFEEYLRRQSAS